MGRSNFVFTLLVSGSMLVGGGCSSHGSTNAKGSGGSTSGTGSGGTGQSAQGGSAPYNNGTVPVDQFGGMVDTKLPGLSAMTNVVAVQGDDGVSITFDPVDGALDYRVYPLPDDADITATTDGHVVIKNAIYRCAGNRETPTPTIDNGAAVGGSAIHTEVDQQTVAGFTRTLAGATLGYVYTAPGDGLVPVYALGDADPNADSTCFFARWTASRVKQYTTSEDERTMLLANFSRDDGIVFYVPATADGTTTAIFTDVSQDGTARYYFADGPEAAMHSTKTSAFPVLTAQAAGTVPLMRVYYNNQCGDSHDELAVGNERFNRVYKQGDKQPWWSLLWTGITGPTTLVVEALDAGCPFQGHLSPQAIPSITSALGDMPIVHQPFITIADAQAASKTTEVFINGQGDPTSQPRPMARAFLKVAPVPHPKMDFFAAFSPNDTPETFTEVPCGAPDGNCYQTWRQQSPTFDQEFTYVESGVGTEGLLAYGPVLGEWWVTYADKSADTNGKYRLTANQMATMDSATFLHATMEVDAYATARRYPQILISDQPAPIQYTLDKGHTLIVQPRAEISPSNDYPIDYEFQICNLVTWDVNQQCPVYDLHHLNDATGKPVHLAPNDEFGEHSSVDHRVVFDVYASTKRAYLFLDGQPYGCADLPDVGVPTGQVTVTWGDVLYHSAVDHTYAFHAAHMQTEQRRHFDNLGFSSGVPAPTWDETRLPCASPIAL